MREKLQEDNVHHNSFCVGGYLCWPTDRVGWVFAECFVIFLEKFGRRYIFINIESSTSWIAPFPCAPTLLRWNTNVQMTITFALSNSHAPRVLAPTYWTSQQIAPFKCTNAICFKWFPYAHAHNIHRPRSDVGCCSFSQVMRWSFSRRISQERILQSFNFAHWKQIFFVICCLCLFALWFYMFVCFFLLLKLIDNCGITSMENIFTIRLN